MSKDNEWIDISVPIYTGMVHFPGDPPIEISHPNQSEQGDVCTVSHLSIGSHSGTHVDAPNHCLLDTEGVDRLSPEAWIGRARVIEIREALEIGEKELSDKKLQRGERILLKTSNSEKCWNRDDFVPSFAHLTLAGAAYLASIGVRTVGIDYLSIAGGDQGPVTHRALLEANVCIIEGLNLINAPAGEYEMVCLPLKIRDGDGAPARALLRKIA
jgi:arylformamidase